MSRPFKCRRICCDPKSDYFKPRGIPVTRLEEINLTMDELETIRLADLEGIYQESAASKMNISRQTFGNIVNSAHKKIADALLNGKALKIKGGVYAMAEMRKFKCYVCNNTWEVPYGTGRPKECTQCKSTNIHRAAEDRGYARRGGAGYGRRRCGRLSV
ncbi:MAG: DUF134 domain-containing protein [Phycisphaerae bacterium]|nr:DUF134 domain-containing protein [Phycisphaerae bacterium]MDD5380677.1 DUF134 domain-containing protein [Phycisphaerae bacterium]